MTLVLPAPSTLNGDALTAELVTAGVAGASVALVGTSVVIGGAAESDATLVAQVVKAHTGQALPLGAVEQTEQTLRTQVESALAQLRAFVTATKPSTAAAQASAAYDASRLCARVLVGLIRLHLRRLDAVD